MNMHTNLMVPNCHTFRLDLTGPSLETGIKVNLFADYPGIYLASEESQKGFVRCVRFDSLNAPRVIEDKIYSADIKQVQTVNNKSCQFLTKRSPRVLVKKFLFKVEIFDPRIKKINEGEFSVEPVIGKADISELVWKKRAGQIVGLESFIKMLEGDCIVITYPGGRNFIGVEDGQLKMLSPNSPAEKHYFAMKAKPDINRVVELASTFPRRPASGDWTTEIEAIKTLPALAKDAFFEKLHSVIVNNVLLMKVEVDGRWQEKDVFQMHIFYEASRQLPKEYISRARSVLLQVSKQEKAEMPYPIVEKFNLSAGLPIKKPVVRAAKKTDNKAPRRERDRVLRSQMKGKN